ncbi:MAG: imidazoleglycerol-phosphate dehydratase HisB [Calditrichaeota bacterium]|nr:MAG: imidazoleglycerol-phosphate dehydratase HisB [Calditrichota bacterium]
MNRTAKIHRKTGETNIELTVNLDGTGQAKIETGIGFFDHMLHLLAVHSLMDISVKAAGDLHVDMHHTVEDIGIALGDALGSALGDKSGIHRYGMAYVPLDESLARCVIDFCGRSFLYFEHELNGTFAGQFPGELVEDFLQAFVNNGQFTLHCDIIRGRNVHHMIEVVFKSLGQSIRRAVSIDRLRTGIPSSKGVL